MINSNSVVESLWSDLKRHYLRRHPKATLELLGEILMKQYLLERRRTIYAIRSQMHNPPWYIEWNRQWRARIQRLLEEAQDDDNPESLFQRQQQQYQTDLHNWWCHCPDYANDPYHTCKHLIRFYGESRGVIPGEPQAQAYPHPIFGEVYRQHVPPLLWVKGLHDEDQLVTNLLECDLEDLTPQEEEVLAQVDTDQQPASASDDDNDQEQEEEEEHVRNRGRRDTGISGEAVAFNERVLSCREKKENIRSHMTRMQRTMELMQGILDLEDGHPHILEAPDPGPAHWKAWESYGRRRRALANARVVRSTFSEGRRGLVFAGNSV